MNRDGLGERGTKGFHMREKIRCFTRTCLVVLVGIGVESEERAQWKVCHRDGAETGGLGLEEWRER